MRKKDTGEIFAMKVLRKAVVVRKRKGMEHTRNERNILEVMRHPFIVDLKYAFQTNGKLYLVMRYLSGGELFFHLSKNHMFSEEIVRFYAVEILLALEFLHSEGVIYRDLKPENICLDSDGHVCLTDFGLAKEAVHSEHAGASSFCGTPEYMAPEILMRCGHGKAVDWWSYGVLLYEMLTGTPPFVGANRTGTYSKILKDKLYLPAYLSQEAKSLLRRLLARSPTKRLSLAEDVKRQAFFNNVNWEDALGKKLKPPFVPTVDDGQADYSNFDPKFTKQLPSDSPVSPCPNGIFEGFSYVAPSVIHDVMDNPQSRLRYMSIDDTMTIGENGNQDGSAGPSHRGAGTPPQHPYLHPSAAC